MIACLRAPRAGRQRPEAGKERRVGYLKLKSLRTLCSLQAVSRCGFAFKIIQAFGHLIAHIHPYIPDLPFGALANGSKTSTIGCAPVPKIADPSCNAPMKL